jgi:arylsulfatase A
MTYSEMVASMDIQVGRLLTALKQLGLEEKTIVFFTGDNGTPVGSYIDVRDGKMRKQPVVSLLGDREIPGGKGQLTDWGTRVPLLIRWPGVIEPVASVNDLVDFSDFMPTFLALAGADAPGGVKLNGVSFAPRLTGSGAGSRDWAYSEQGKTDAFWTRTANFKLYNDGRFFAMDDTGEESAPLDTSALTPTAKGAYELLSEALRKVQD